MARSNTGSGSNRFASSVTTALPSTAPITIACWFRPANLTANNNLVFVSNTAGTNYFGVIFDGANANGLGDNVVLAECNNTTTADAVSASGGTAGSWMHCGAVFTSSTSRQAFINGAGGTINTTSKTPSSPNGHIDIGCIFISPTAFSPLNGDIAEIGIWDVALTAAEMLQLSKGFSPLTVRPNNLVRYWPLMGVGTEVCVISGAALTMTGTMGKAAHAPTFEPAPLVIGFPSGATISNADGAAAGTGTATGIGASEAASPGSASGTGTATGIGSSLAASVASAAGTGTATALSISTAAASGTGTATGVGASLAASPGSASGVGAATGIGASQAASVASAAGAGTATGVGASTADATAAASGTGTATGLSVEGSVASASGVGAATGIGASLSDAAASASGTGTAEAEGATAVEGSVASASGVGEATGIGASIAEAVGEASGTGTADGVAFTEAVANVQHDGDASSSSSNNKRTKAPPERPRAPPDKRLPGERLLDIARGWDKPAPQPVPVETPKPAPVEKPKAAPPIKAPEPVQAALPSTPTEDPLAAERALRAAQEADDEEALVLLLTA